LEIAIRITPRIRDCRFSSVSPPLFPPRAGATEANIV